MQSFKICSELSVFRDRNQEGASSASAVHSNRGSRDGAAQAVDQSKRSHMTKAPTLTFHSHNFRAVMGFILENVQPRWSFY